MCACILWQRKGSMFSTKEVFSADCRQPASPTHPDQSHPTPSYHSAVRVCVCMCTRACFLVSRTNFCSLNANANTNASVDAYVEEGVTLLIKLN